MELSFLGANCLSLITKNAKVVFDPFVPGIKIDTKKFNLVVLSHDQEFTSQEEQLLINTPGEYEAGGLSLQGIPARAHMDEEGKRTATIFRVDTLGMRLAVMGHIYPDMSDEQLERLGIVDVLIIPVGGHGYTLDAEGAAKVIRAIEPKVVIPTHYADKAVSYEVPQAELQLFLDEIGAPVVEETKYKIKPGVFPEQLTVIKLNRTS